MTNSKKYIAYRKELERHIKEDKVPRTGCHAAPEKTAENRWKHLWETQNEQSKD